MVESGRLKPGTLVSRTLGLEEAGDVLASMERYATLGIPVINRY
jgi:hypothetical protein